MRIRLAILVVLIGLLVDIQPSVAADLPLIEPCSVSNVAPCIESFTATSDSGTKLVGKLSGKSFPSRQYFATQAFVGTEYEWEIPGINQPSGNSYFNILAEYYPLNTPYCWLPNQLEANCDHGIDEMALWVYPSMRYSSPPPQHFPKLPSDKICGSTDNPSYCYLQWDLSENYKYEIKLKIPSSFTPGTMAANGKTGSAAAELNPDGTRTVLLSGIPIVNRWTLNNPPLTPPANEDSTAIMSRIELAFFLQSTKSLQSQWANQCNDGHIVTYWHNTGIGTTPVWSPAESAIVMETGGTHLTSDGTLNEGLIELQIPVKMANCLWNVDLSKQVMATMTATYSNGAAPEVISTRSTIVDDIYILTSYGFHYSNPHIAIKLKQVDPVLPEVAAPVTQTAVVIPQTKKNLTISCLKGRVLRRISGSNPKCPAGYKLKK